MQTDSTPEEQGEPLRMAARAVNPATGRVRALLARLGVLQRGSVQRQVVSAAAVVACFTFAAKLAGAAKEIFVAKHFGTSDQVDAFLVALLAPALVTSVVGNSLNYAFMPAYVEARQRGGPGAGQALLASTTALTLRCLAPLALLLAVAMPYVLPWAVGGFHGEKARLTVQLLWVLLPIILISTASTTWTAVLNAHGRFARPASAAIAVPCVAIGALVLFGNRFGIHALAVGTVAGYVVEAALVAHALRGEGLSILPRWSGFGGEVRRVVSQFAPAASAMVFTAVNPVIDQLMAGRLAPGSVASLGYGNKLVAFGIAIGYGSVASAVLPHFSRLAADKDWHGLDRSIRSYAFLVSAVTIPVTLAMMACSPWIVRVLFQHGAFTPADTVLVARIQALYLAQIPFAMVSVLFNRFLVATGGNSVLLRVSVASAVVNVAANWALIQVLGVSGIALSTSAVYALTCTMNFVYFRRRLRTLEAAPARAAA